MSLVSIIIPCYNAAPWLGATLESALAQTWSQCEIIVIDDGSTDGSVAVAEAFEPRGVRVYRQPNRGASVARNHGRRVARGRYLQFLDADDLLTPDKIAGQVELLARHHDQAVASCRWGRFEHDPGAVVFADPDLARDLSAIEFLLLHTRDARMMHPAAWLTPRAIADRAGPWDEALTLNDDGEYFTRIVLAAGAIKFSAPGASLYRSQLSSSLSRRRDDRALASLVRSVERIAAHVQSAEDSPRVRAALAEYWQRLVYELYPQEPAARRRATAKVRELGGARLPPAMGARERWVARFVGWKLARRLRLAFFR